jgi:hypothetical protein
MSKDDGNIPEDHPMAPTEPEEEDFEALIDDLEESATGTSEASRADNVVQLLPVHAAPNTGKNALKVDRRVGRPRKVERMPTTSDLEYHAKMAEQKAKFIDEDPVVKAASKATDPMTMLSIIKAEVAKESAALHFQRMENEKFGRDVAQVSSRRIDALKKIADIELEVKKLGGDVIDVHSEKFARIFTLWIEIIREIAEQTMTPEQLDLFFNRLTTAMEGWEDKAAEALR